MAANNKYRKDGEKAQIFQKKFNNWFIFNFINKKTVFFRYFLRKCKENELEKKERRKEMKLYVFLIHLIFALQKCNLQPSNIGSCFCCNNNLLQR